MCEGGCAEPPAGIERGVRRGDWSVRSVWVGRVVLKRSRKGFCSCLRMPCDINSAHTKEGEIMETWQLGARGMKGEGLLGNLEFEDFHKVFY